MRLTIIKLGLALVIILGLVLVVTFAPFSINQFSPERIKDFVLKFDTLAPFVFIGIYSLRSVVLVIPVGITSLVGGLVFGTWWGTIYILTGATTGACIAFLIARFWGRDLIERIKWLRQDHIKKIDNGIEKHGFRFIIFLRLIPFFQYDVINYGAGFSKMKFQDFAFGSFIGMIPGGFIKALLGNSMKKVISVQSFFALVVFAILIFIPAI